MKNNFAASVLNKIHKKKISPRERYYFVCRVILKIVALIFFLLFGMLAMAVLLHLVHNIAFLEFVIDRPRVFMKFFWFGVPLFWIVMTVALWGVTEKVVEQTDRAYRIPFWAIGLSVLVLQVGGGIILEQSRVGERADLMFEQRMSWYHGAERINRRAERMPEDGFLGGEVVSMESDTLFVLSDMTEKVWRVQLLPVRVPREKLEEGMRIQMVGEMISNNEFLAVSWRSARKGPRMDGPRDNMRPRPFLFERLRDKRGF